MNLLDLAVKITCDDQASGQVEGIGSRITGTFGRIGGMVSAIMGSAAVAGAVAIGKSALDAYADYEQLVGGIDTLFKESSARMQQYAASAYQTAGVSANRYMEISTSFAASLISSLGGDTAAAADMANMAIMDMSDNANKMGTSLEVVQEAYQSLARGNYEMLDSLKLGYGGTKKELERLLSDAEEIAAAQGMVRDFSVDSYADIVEAIHLVQDEMGITGTTAAEAATTISGSVNSMKAAWENWLAGLGNEDADMSALTDQLVQSVITAGRNVIPRVGEIMTSLGSTLASHAPQVAQQLYDGLMAALPESVREPLQRAVDGAGEVLGYLQETFGPGIQQAMELVGPIVQQVGEFFSHMGTQIQTVLGPALDYLGPAFANFMSALQPWIEPLSNVAQIFGNILVAAISAFTYALGGVMNIFSAVTAVIADFDAFLSGQPSVIGTVIQGIIAWFQQLPGNIANFLSSVISSVVSWVSSMVSNAQKAGSQFLGNVSNFVSQLPGKVAGFLSSALSKAASFVGNFASKAIDAGSKFLSNIVRELGKVPGRVLSIGQDIVRGVWDGISGMASWFTSQVSGFFGGIVDSAKAALGIASPSKVMRSLFKYVPIGAALGIDDEAGATRASVTDMIDGMLYAVESGVKAVESVMSSLSAPGVAAPYHDVAYRSSAVAPLYSGGGRGDTYYLYVDGSLVRVDSRIGAALDALVDAVGDEIGMK